MITDRVVDLKDQDPTRLSPRPSHCLVQKTVHIGTIGYGAASARQADSITTNRDEGIYKSLFIRFSPMSPSVITNHYLRWPCYRIFLR